jgi:hypothetical protein
VIERNHKKHKKNWFFLFLVSKQNQSELEYVTSLLEVKNSHID